MSENIPLTDMPGGVSQVEQGYGLSTSPDMREGNARNGGRQQRSMPLGVALTGYRLFTTSWILGLGIPKAVYSNRGQSLISPTLDWSGGIILSLVSFWLGVIETSRPELCPHFFEVDLAPCILKFLRRDDVHLWFTSVPPLLLAVNVMSFVRQVSKSSTSGDVAHFSKDGLTQVVLGLSMAVFLFCLRGLRVLWPKGFEGIGRIALPIFGHVMMAHVLFLGAKFFRTNSNDAISLAMIVMTIRLYIWMMPWAALHFSERFLSEEFPPILQYFAQYYNVILCIFPVMFEMGIMTTWGVPEFPEALNSFLFLCCVLVPIWRRLFAIILGHLFHVYRRTIHHTVRSAGREMWVSVWRIYDGVRGTGS